MPYWEVSNVTSALGELKSRTSDIFQSSTYPPRLSQENSHTHYKPNISTLPNLNPCQCLPCSSPKLPFALWRSGPASWALPTWCRTLHWIICSSSESSFWRNTSHWQLCWMSFKEPMLGGWPTSIILCLKNKAKCFQTMITEWYLVSDGLKRVLPYFLSTEPAQHPDSL